MALPTKDWIHDRDLAGTLLAKHQFSPSWEFPSLNQVRCALGHGCAGSGPVRTAGDIAQAAADKKAKEAASKLARMDFDRDGRPKGPPGWPLGVQKDDKEIWTPKDVEELRRKLPAYQIKGPGTRAVCWGQGRLDEPHRKRLIELKRNVRTVEEAAKICDNMEGCTHFWIVVGPDYPSLEDYDLGVPYRAEFCRGDMVSTVDDLQSHSFVGIKKNVAFEHDLPPPEDNMPPLPIPEGALEPYGRDVGYYRTLHERVQKIREKRQLERLESKANQLEAYEKAKSAKEVKAQLKSLEQRLPLASPAASAASFRVRRARRARSGAFL